MTAEAEALHRIEGKLDMLLRAVLALTAQGARTMSALDDLKAEVEQTKTVEESAIKLIGGLATQLAAAIASNDPAQLTALQQALAAERTSLAAAITANTAPPATTATP